MELNSASVVISNGMLLLCKKPITTNSFPGMGMYKQASSNTLILDESAAKYLLASCLFERSDLETFRYTLTELEYL